MPSRHRSRERALQMIYQWEATGAAPDEVIGSYWAGPADALVEGDETTVESGAESGPLRKDPFAGELFQGVARRVAALDELISSHATNWKIERMAAVDRNILRLAVYELKQGETPAAIAIDEAIELARRFSGDQSARFVNGILDAVRKSLEQSEGAQQPAPAADPAAG